MVHVTEPHVPVASGRRKSCGPGSLPSSSTSNTRSSLEPGAAMTEGSGASMSTSTPKSQNSMVQETYAGSSLMSMLASLDADTDSISCCHRSRRSRPSSSTSIVATPRYDGMNDRNGTPAGSPSGNVSTCRVVWLSRTLLGPASSMLDAELRSVDTTATGSAGLSGPRAGPGFGGLRTHSGGSAPKPMNIAPSAVIRIDVVSSSGLDELVSRPAPVAKSTTPSAIVGSSGSFSKPAIVSSRTRAVGASTVASEFAATTVPSLDDEHAAAITTMTVRTTTVRPTPRPTAPRLEPV